MLKYNFTRILKAKAIDRPYSFLRKAGFSENFSSKVKNNRINRLNLDILERLCVCLGCTPNDLMEWKPDSHSALAQNHPLNTLRRDEKILDLTAIINSLPLSKLEEIEQLLKEDK